MARYAEQVIVGGGIFRKAGDFGCSKLKNPKRFPVPDVLSNNGAEDVENPYSPVCL